MATPELPHPPSSDRDAWEKIAKNPEPGRIIYRGERRSRSPLVDHPDPPVQGRPRVEDDEVGLHWTVNAPYSRAFGHRNDEQDTVTYRAVIDDPEAQVVPYGRLNDYSVTRTFGFRVDRRHGQGALREGEVRLRPGAKIRMLGEQWGGQDEETVLPEDTFKTVSYPAKRSEDPKHPDLPNPFGYLGIAEQSVPGTPQRRQHELEEALLPQTQPALFTGHRADDGSSTIYTPTPDAVGYERYDETFPHAFYREHDHKVTADPMDIKLPHWSLEESEKPVPRRILDRIKDTRTD